MKKIFTLTLALLASFSLWAANGEVLFTQDFSSATSVSLSSTTNKAAHLNSESGNNIFGSTAASQFTSLYAAQKSSAGYAINDGDYSQMFGVNANNTGWKYCLAKTTDFAAEPPTALKIVMSITLNGLNGDNSAAVCGFAVGSGFSDATAMDAQKADSMHSAFSFQNANNNHVITSYNTTTSISSTNKLTNNTQYTITWIINNTGSSLEYTNPNSTTTTLADDQFDVWVGTTQYVSGRAADHGGKRLRQMIIGDPAGKKHQLKIHSIVVTDLSPVTYSVTYKANGGTGDDVVDTKALTVASNPFTYSGKAFVGWNTKANGTGASYAVGDAVSEDMTLYAQWSDIYTVTYNKNGGTGTMDNTQNEIVACTFTAPAGKTFKEWNTAADGTGTKYEVGAAVTGDLDLFAIWKNGPQTVFHYQWTGSSTAPTANEALTATGGTFTFNKTTTTSFGTASVTYHSGVSADMKTTAETNEYLVKVGNTSNNSYLVTLTGDKYFEEGDTVFFAGYGNFRVGTSHNAEDIVAEKDALETGTGASDVNVGSFIFPAIENVNNMYFTRHTTSSERGFTAVKVIRPAKYAVTFNPTPSDGTLVIMKGETPISSNDNIINGTVLTVTATATTANYTLATLTANGVDIKDAKQFTVTDDVEVVATFSPTTALNDVENEVKAVKVLRNGQLFIEKAGKTYNAQGQLVK